MIRFDKVGFRYDSGPDVLNDIDFELKAGSYHFLTGPSGAGKTSLLSLMYLGHRPTRGNLFMFNQNVGTLPRERLYEIRQKIGIVFQDFRLLGHLSAFDNVALPLRILKRPEKEIRNNVTELLDWVGLGDSKDKLPPTLSGGQQQRIAIARAVITRPKLLLADEPTGNLDDAIGFRLMNLFEQLNRMGTTIVIATHNTHIMEKYGHPRMILAHGNLTLDEHRNKAEETAQGPLTANIKTGTLKHAS
ncbi:MAG: ATP-binding cassette domain-containing protein [Alphaproteobacteria bacterium]|nr:ATP-binding cassette domain-containing protein [Alphaproteobacteria bacterium]MCB9974777.1 ATP-binding cassette domain-containing protein [Rhodospirillales bacterium]